MGHHDQRLKCLVLIVIGMKYLNTKTKLNALSPQHLYGMCRIVSQRTKAEPLGNHSETRKYFTETEIYFTQPHCAVFVEHKT